jgi:elongation factor G
MDFDPIEKRRGITISSAATHVQWSGHHFNIIDTPGHVDFTVEVERSLRVLDGAVLVLCAVGGVQSQSTTVDRQMRRYGVPRIALINKMDRTGANPVRVIQQLRDRLDTNAVAIQLPIGSAENFAGIVDLVTMKAVYFDGEDGAVVRCESIPENLSDLAQSARAQMLESLAFLDDRMMEIVGSGENPSAAEIIRVLRAATLARTLTPVLMASAYKNAGVQPVLDAIRDFLPDPSERITFASVHRGGTRRRLRCTVQRTTGRVRDGGSQTDADRWQSTRKRFVRMGVPIVCC